MTASHTIAVDGIHVGAWEGVQDVMSVRVVHKCTTNNVLHKFRCDASQTDRSIVGTKVRFRRVGTILCEK